MATDKKEVKEEIVNNSAENVAEKPTPVEETTENTTTEIKPEGETTDEKAEEVIADAVDGVTEEETTPDPIATQLPNVEITEANKAEIEALIERAEYGDRSRENNQKLAAILQSDPDLPAIFMDISKGATFVEAAARRIDFSAITPAEGEPDYDKWSAANNERMTNFENSKKRKATIAENEAKSQETLKKFIGDKELDDEASEKFFNYLHEALTQAFDGLLSYDLLDRMYTAMNHGTEVENARTEGELKGKNAKISDLKDKDKKEVTTGLPEMSGGGSQLKMPEKGDPFIEGLKQRTSRKPVLG